MSQRHEVHVICSSPQSPIEVTSYPVYTVKCGWYVNSPVTFLNYFNPRATLQIRTILDKIKPDLIHLHNVARLGLDFLPNGVATVQTIHDFWYFCPRSDSLDFSGKPCENSYFGFKCILCGRDCIPFLTNTLRKALIRRFLNKIDLFIFPSKATMRTFAQREGAFERSVVIPHGIRVPEPPRSYDVGDPLRVLFVGRVERQKGIQYLVEAVQNVAGIQLDILGGGELQRSLKAYIDKKGIRNVRMHGFVSEEIKWAYYENSDVVVVPSLWPEVSSLVAMEALSKGNVVIVTHLGGASELVDNGVNGFVLNPDSATIRDKLLYLAKNPDVTQRMKREARRKAESTYRFQDHIARIENCYKLTLESARSERTVPGWDSQKISLSSPTVNEDLRRRMVLELLCRR